MTLSESIMTLPNPLTEGSSLMPLMEDPESSDWKKAVFWQYPRYPSIQVPKYPGNPGNQVPQVDQNNCVKCLLRGGKIVDHLKNTMGYSMRTAEWRYTEWVCIALYF